jgi:molybdate transport system substrate-binding protein
MANCSTFVARLIGMAVAGAFSLIVATSVHAAEKVTVFAAASLKNALDAVSAAWTADTQKETRISYAASSTLAKQIQDGAPADIFFSADMDWMTSLVEAQLIADGSVVKLLGNTIVLIAPADSRVVTKIEPNFDLRSLLEEGKLAMGDVKAVPAGKYGKAALQSLGVWAFVESKVVMTENVRAALKLVSIGEAAAGIVYFTDAKADQSVKIIGVFPANSHDQIVYPVGRVADSKNTDAAEFIAYLQSAKAQAIFKDQGFTVLLPAAN